MIWMLVDVLAGVLPRKAGVIMSRTCMDNLRITLTNVITTHGGIDGGRSG